MGCFPCFDPKGTKNSHPHKPRGGGRKKFHQREDKLASYCSILRPRKGASHPKDLPNSNSSPKSFTFCELASATNNFSPHFLLREEEFGYVYKGTLPNGQVVAIKRLNGDVRQCNTRLLVEVLMLSCLSHPNIVTLIGHCSDRDRRLLIYEFLPLGPLVHHLHDLPPDQEPLHWNTRMKIATGAAKALEYLHEKASPRVIFRDFKTSCILLDEGYSPKVFNFALAKIGSIRNQSHIPIASTWTNGYCAPEHATTGQLTVKSDLYSFGVVLLEIITGRKAIDSTRPQGDQSLVEWARPFLGDIKNLGTLADPRMKGKFPMHGLRQALTVASMCIQEDVAARPSIADVVTVLSYLTNQSNDSGADTNHRIDEDEDANGRKDD